MIHKYVRLLSYALHEWPRLTGIVVLTLLSSIVAVAQPWPLKLLVDYALVETPADKGWEQWFSGMSATSLIIIAAVAALLIALFSALLDAAMTWMWSVTGQRMTMALAADLFDRLQRLSLKFHSRNHVGDALSRITGDSYCLYTLTDALLVRPLHQLATLVMVGAVAWQLNAAAHHHPHARHADACGVWLVFRPTPAQRRRARREANARMTSFLQQTLGAIPVVQAFCAENRNRQKYQELAGEIVRHRQSGHRDAGQFQARSTAWARAWRWRSCCSSAAALCSRVR